MDNQHSYDVAGKNPQSPKLLSGFSVVLCLFAVVGNVIAVFWIAPRG
jgi:hypothetical protein